MDVIVGLVIRHAASIIGTWLATTGFAASNEVEAITGGLVAVGAVVWSWYQKRQAGLLPKP